MKKRLISLLLVAGMALGLTACGGASAGKHMTVTIEGNKYDLSGDFQDVVGEMVKDDIHVCFTYAQQLEFDKDGYFQRIEDIGSMRDEHYIYAGEQQKMSLHGEKTVDDIVYQYFELGKGNVDYKTADGITNESEDDDAEELEFYVAQQGYRWPRNRSYAAFYIDGKIVDLTEYEDELEEIIEKVEEENVGDVTRQYLRGLVGFADTRFANSVRDGLVMQDLQQAQKNDSMQNFNEKYPLFEEDMLLALAFMDAGEKLLEGDIDSYTLIAYEFDEVDDEDVAYTYYYNYYKDENYDRNKFQKK